MAKYSIEIKETLSMINIVEADSLEEAIRKTKSDYSEGKIVLDSENFVETDFINLIEDTDND